jgi:anthranilate/para-aminobenzoate synthase component I
VCVVLPAARLPAPLDALDAAAGAAHPFLRHAEGPGFRGRPWSFLALAPSRVLRGLGRARRLADRLADLRPATVVRHGPRLPFAGGWAGLLGYEARAGIEATPPRRRPPLGFPSLWLGRYEAVAAWDHRAGGRYVAGLGRTRREAEGRARALGRRLGRGARRAPARDGGTGVPRPRQDARTFQRAVRRAREAVLRGDIFQANVSQRYDARTAACPRALFRRLVASQPAPYMTYLDLGGGRVVLSASPERFLRVRGRVVETDPMKGTRPRGRDRAEDRRLRAALEASAKDRAELAMIVDLARNDLARVCRPGSVRVAVPRRLLRFARVHQAIAVVRGTLAAGHDRVDAVQAAFPPGSVTGAPKVRAMEVIDDLEGEGRGPYCGALGWFDEGGDMDLGVAIRTILLSGATASYRVGGGITLGSDPHEEWRETLAKGRGLFAALCGAEDES